MATVIAPPVNQGCRARCTFDPDDIEQIGRTFSILTIHPLNSLLCFFFPIFGAITSSYLKIQRDDDVAQKARISLHTKTRLFEEIDDLKSHTKICRNVNVYTGLIHSFHSYGGPISITSPLIAIPQHRLTRPREPGQDIPDFGDEIPEIHRLKENPWLFSDDETRYFISREMGHIKHNHAIFRVLVKIAIVAAAFFMYFGPLGILTGAAIILAAVGLYVLSERCLQGKMDIYGVEILGRKYNDEIRAAQVAIGALKKIQLQNVARRTGSFFTRMYVSKAGNNFLDINNPLLTNRISRLEKHLEKLQNEART